MADINNNNIWIDVETLAKLKNITRRAVRLALNQNKYEYKVENIRGGKTYKIKLSTLEEELQLKYFQEYFDDYKTCDNEVIELSNHNIKQLIDSAPTVSQQPEEEKRTELTQDKQIKTDVEKCVNSLTNQERAIFHSLAKTANYEKTAKAFFISLSTLKSHVNSIFQKLYVNSLPELIKIYYTKIFNSKILENTDISQISDLRNKYMDKLSKLQSEISNIKIKISVLDDLKKQIINEKT